MKKLLIVAMMGTVSYGAYRLLGSEEHAATDGEQLVLDRIWLDHVPKNDRDTVQVFVSLSEESFGLFQNASTWKGAYEVFRYEAHGNELRLTYPQSNERETLRHKARRCTEQGMDFCLELDGGTRGVKRYYSRKGWEIEGVPPAQVDDKVDALVKSL
ncbi:MAG TPA: hypothetical protein VK427_21610 [Kofleriaceae bacterium]|nr:hypothetical protein [Kofleriaceae bacterium]